MLMKQLGCLSSDKVRDQGVEICAWEMNLLFSFLAFDKKPTS